MKLQFSILEEYLYLCIYIHTYAYAYNTICIYDYIVFETKGCAAFAPDGSNVQVGRILSQTTKVIYI